MLKTPLFTISRDGGEGGGRLIALIHPCATASPRTTASTPSDTTKKASLNVASPPQLVLSCWHCRKHIWLQLNYGLDCICILVRQTGQTPDLSVPNNFSAQHNDPYATPSRRSLLSHAYAVCFRRNNFHCQLKEHAFSLLLISHVIFFLVSRATFRGTRQQQHAKVGQEC